MPALNSMSAFYCFFFKLDNLHPNSNIIRFIKKDFSKVFPACIFVIEK